MQHPIKVVYICSSGHSGSTLLGLLLGSQPGLASFGEVEQTVGRLGLEAATCTCGAPDHECPVWSEVRAELHGSGLARRPTRPVRLIRTLIAERDRSPRRVGAKLLYRTLKRTSGCQVVVDSSKSPFYLRHLSRVPEIDVFAIHLVRDGRAVAFSSARKGRDFSTYAARWKSDNEAMLAVLSELPGDRWMRVRYEDVVGAPERVIERILSALDRPSASIELDWRSREYHHLQGNRMRFSERREIVPDTAYLGAIEDEAWEEATGRLRPPLEWFGYPETKAGARAMLEPELVPR